MKYVILAIFVVVLVLALIFRKPLKNDISSAEADLKLALSDVKREALGYKIKLIDYAGRIEIAAKKDEASVVAEAKKVASEIRGLF